MISTVDNEGPVHDIIVIGGGPAGTSAAIYASRAKMDIVVIDKDIGSSAMGGVHLVANYPGFPKPVEAEVLLKKMREQAVNLGARYVQDKVIYTDFREDVKIVATPETSHRSKVVIIASGSMGREPSIKGEREYQGRGVAYCAICDGPFFEGKEIVVVGQADRVREELELLSRYVTRIRFVSATGSIPDEDMKKLEDLDVVETIDGFGIREIKGDDRVKEIVLAGADGEKELRTDGVFLYLQGNKPVLDYITDRIDKSDEGCIKVDDEMETNMSGVFAVGDVTCKKVRQISVAVSQGCRAALSSERYLKGKDKVISQWGT
jgi:thioredoxin reductase (NADPH)